MPISATEPTHISPKTCVVMIPWKALEMRDGSGRKDLPVSLGLVSTGAQYTSTFFSPGWKGSEVAYAGLADALQCHWPAAQFSNFEATPHIGAWLEMKGYLEIPSIWTALEAFWESENQQMV